MEKWIAYPDCKMCGGKGWHIGGDDMQQCASCSLRKYGRRNQEIEISYLIPNEYGPTWDDVIEHIRDGCCGDYFASTNAQIEADLRAGKEIVEHVEVMPNGDGSFLVLDGHHRTALSLEYGRATVPYVIVDEDFADEYR